MRTNLAKRLLNRRHEKSVMYANKSDKKKGVDGETIFTLVCALFISIVIVVCFYWLSA